MAILVAIRKNSSIPAIALCLFLVGCLSQGSYPAPVLGVSVDKNLIVVDVHKGGAADQAGIQVQDKLLALDGEALNTPEAWWLKISEFEVGETYEVTLERASETPTLPVTAARPPINWAPGTTPTAFPTGQFSLH